MKRFESDETLASAKPVDAKLVNKNLGKIAAFNENFKFGLHLFYLLIFLFMSLDDRTKEMSQLATDFVSKAKSCLKEQVVIFIFCVFQQVVFHDYTFIFILTFSSINFYCENYMVEGL